MRRIIRKMQLTLLIIIVLSCVSTDNNYNWMSTQFLGHLYFEYSSDPSLYITINERNRSDSLPTFFLLSKTDTVMLSYLMESSPIIVLKARKSDFKGSSLNDTLYYTQQLPEIIDTFDLFYREEGSGLFKRIPKASDYSKKFGVKLIDE